MEYMQWLLVFFFILTQLFGTAIADDPPQYCYGANYTSDSVYRTNINTALSSISSSTNNIYGFYNSSIGQEPNKVSAIAICRGDVDPDICRTCVKDATQQLTLLCPNQTDAIVWYEKCTLRYSNSSIFHTLATYPLVTISDNANATQIDAFNQVLRTLLDGLRDKAVKGGPLQKFAADSVAGPDFQVIFALVQCSPDLSNDLCSDCLISAAGHIPKCCEGKQGAIILQPSCTLSFSNSRFYNDTTNKVPPVLVSPPPPPPAKDNSKSITIYLIGVSSVLSLMHIIVCFCIFIWRRKQRKLLEKLDSANESSSWESLQVDFAAIAVATRNFSDTNKLGQGAFGAVYKGVLSNGQKIAVKRLSMDSRQGEQEFKNEASLLAKLQHRNLVRLLGFSLEGKERLLIYEFVPNSSLDHFIFNPLKRVHLNWNSIHKIICGIARGIVYLHEDSRLRIIHRDLKPSNILLDAEMNPKIADFGLARLFDFKETHANTKRIIGTSGYMAPEYVKQGEFSVKSDVFSFGIIVLEIIMARKSNCFQNEENDDDLLSYAWKIWEEKRESSDMIDSSLRTEQGFELEMMRCIHIGLLCTQEKIYRPTIASAYVMLTSSALALAVPLKPPFILCSTMDPKLSTLQHNFETNESS